MPEIEIQPFSYLAVTAPFLHRRPYAKAEHRRIADQIGHSEFLVLLLKNLNIYNHCIRVFAHHALRPDGVALLDRLENDLVLGVVDLQAEMLTGNGRKEVGDYTMFAARAGSLVLNANLFALDEYGVPAETARRIALGGVPPETLDQALAIVIATDTSATSNLHPFERDIISDLKSTLPTRPT